MLACGAAPKILYYFHSTDIVFGVNPIMNVIDINTGSTIKSVDLSYVFPQGTVLAAFNNGNTQQNLLLFGYRRKTDSSSPWELILSQYDITTFNATTVGTITISGDLDALWDPSPSFGYDADLNAVFSLDVVEFEMNITKYDFANGQFSTIFVPPANQEPYNFQPSGTYDPVSKTYYINFYNQNSMLEILEYNVVTGQVDYSHIYAHYPDYPITSLYYMNDNLYGSFNPDNMNTQLYQVNTNNNTFTQVFTVEDDIDYGVTVYAYNNDYIVYITHLSQTQLSITTLELATLTSTSTQSDATNFPTYPLPVPVAAFI